MLVCLAAAKINLTLDVLARRDDGYHLLRSVVHSVGLWDTLHFEFGIGPGFSLRSNWPALMTEDNLCLQAAKAWVESAAAKTPQRFGGVRITLQKTIPMGSGLGGGSSNAAATLLALNHHHQNLLDPGELEKLALTLGADVPFFLKGGCALMEGIGEQLTPLPPVKGWVVLICPAFHAVTAEIFRTYDQTAPVSAASSNESFIEAVQQADLNSIGGYLHNDLLDAATSGNFNPEPLLKVLLANGAIGASMTGSGSTLFGLFKARRAAQDARSLIADGLSKEYRVYAVPLNEMCFELMPAQ